MLGWTPFSYPFNLTQQPACTIPCGLTSDGLPIGLQIVGPMFGDALVLRAARAYETVRPIARPDLAALRRRDAHRPDDRTLAAAGAQTPTLELVAENGADVLYLGGGWRLADSERIARDVAGLDLVAGVPIVIDGSRLAEMDTSAAFALLSRLPAAGPAGAGSACVRWPPTKSG